jgi:hypothetical protein
MVRCAGVSARWVTEPMAKFSREMRVVAKAAGVGDGADGLVSAQQFPALERARRSADTSGRRITSKMPACARAGAPNSLTEATARIIGSVDAVSRKRAACSSAAPAPCRWETDSSRLQVKELPTFGYSPGKPIRAALSRQSLVMTPSSLASSEISGHVR